MYSARGIAISVLVAIVMVAVVIFAGVLPLSAQENNPPTAHIDSISPSPAEEGETVFFRGHGTDPDYFDWVLSYHWTSSIDGELSTRSTFMTRDLSAGTHIISLRVGDREGLWSEPVNQSLVVKPLVPKLVDDDWDYWTNQPNMFSIPTGNVGIGTKYPQKKLDIVNSFGAGYTNLGIRLSPGIPGGKTWQIDNAGDFQITEAFAGPGFPKTRLAISHMTGNVGIGTMSPENKLHIAGAINLDSVPEPTAPSSGFVIYVDEDGGQLKAKSYEGTITVLADP